MMPDVRCRKTPETQETLALLKILALGNKQVAESRVKPVGEVVKRLRARPPERQ